LSKSTSTTDLYQPFLGERNVDSTDSQKRPTALCVLFVVFVIPVVISVPRVVLLLDNLCAVIHNLGGCGDQGHQLGKLLAKFVDAGSIYLEEKVGLGPLGEAGPIRNELEWVKAMNVLPYRISPWILWRSKGADILESRELGKN
jgi:hypothetical protein